MKTCEWKRDGVMGVYRTECGCTYDDEDELYTGKGEEWEAFKYCPACGKIITKEEVEDAG